MSKRDDSGRDPTPEEFAELERLARLHPSHLERHASALPADHAKLGHVNTYGELPRFYVDRPFTCRECGKREIWRARDQKWYYEEAGGHIDAVAVECHDCRARRKQGRGPSAPDA